MKIESSQVNMSNDYRSDWATARQITAVNRPQGKGEDTVEISEQARNENRAQSLQRQQLLIAAGSERRLIESSMSSRGQTANASGATEPVPSSTIEQSTLYEKGLMVMKILLEKMSGKPIELFDAKAFMQKHDHAQSAGTGVGVSGDTPPPLGQIEGEGGQNPQQWLKVTTYQYESQSNLVEISGSIEQQNGKTSQFSFAVGFSQEYESLSIETIQREQLKDPLVISFSTKPVQLSDQKFAFDIDADSQADNIAMLKSGYGFLALDKNGDNSINDGSELFGALSGDGFSELAQYDQDQNGYIDENDDIFNELSVWIKNEGEDKLVSLKDSGIGAIALQNVDSPLNIRDSEGEDKLGVIRKTGYYLNEDGSAGLVQQLDFVV